MQILYDYQILYDQMYGGISRYYYDLTRTIREQKLAKAVISCKYSRNQYFKGVEGVETTDGFFDRKPSVYRRALRYYGHRVNQRTILEILDRGETDIVHPTYYHTYLLNYPKVKKVITVYDMIQEVLREDRSQDRVIERKKKWIYGADHIIAISESTKRDILRFYPDIDENRISVIYIGSNFSGINEKEDQIRVRKDDAKLPERYILFVGKRDGYKNFITFFRAVRPLLQEDRSLFVICAGGGDFSVTETDVIGDLHDQVIMCAADDRMLKVLYQNAQCFVFPSLYEGFGIPVLEAFASGCPAVISKTSSLPEVGGDVAWYFDPLNEDEMRQQIKSAISDPDRCSRIERGYQRLERFSWNLIARQTADCYQKVLEQ